MLKVYALFFLCLLTSCSPYAATAQPGTPTPSPPATIRTFHKIEKPSPTPRPITCTVTTGIDQGAVNLRVGPSTHFSVILTLREGTTAIVLQHGAWMKVSTHNATGFVYGRYCQ